MPDEPIKKRLNRAKRKAIESLSKIGCYVEYINGPSFDIVAARKREWRLIILIGPNELNSKLEKINHLKQIPTLVDEHGIELISKEIWAKNGDYRSSQWIIYNLEKNQWITRDGSILNFESKKTIGSKSQNKLSGHVYFILNKERNLIKIGHTIDIKRRYYELKANSLDNIEILYSIKTANIFESEKKLHEHFARFKIRGEWFKYCEEILRFIQLAKEKQNDRNTESNL